MSVRPAAITNEQAAQAADELHLPPGLAVDGYNSSAPARTSQHPHATKPHHRSEKALKALETRTQSLQEQVAQQNHMIHLLNREIRAITMIMQQQQQQRQPPPAPLPTHPMPSMPFVPLPHELLYSTQSDANTWTYPQEHYRPDSSPSDGWPYTH